MRPSKALSDLSIQEIEGKKKAAGLDSAIADWLLPRGDRLRSDGEVSSRLERLVEERIDPWIVNLVQRGGHKVSRGVFDKAPATRTKRRNADPISIELQNFISRAFQGTPEEGIDRKARRAYSRQLKRTIEEAVWRELGSPPWASRE